MEDTELIAFNIISAVGTARSAYTEAIRFAKSGDFDNAAKQIEKGEAAFTEGHKAHAALLRDEASGNDPKIMTLLLVHAEDQLMAAETFRTLALEFIDVYKKIYAADTP